MQHAGRVRTLQRAEQLLADLRRLKRPERAVLGDQPVERPRLDELHHDPGTAVVFDHVEDRDHARVVQPGRGLGLAERPLVDAVVVGGGPDLLDRNLPGEQLIPAAPDDPHGPAADRLLQPVALRHQAPRGGGRRVVHGPDAIAVTSDNPVSQL